MSPRILKATNIFRDFLFENVYNLQATLPETETSRQVIRNLFDYFSNTPKDCLAEYLLHNEGKWRGVIDYIAGMTDQYALKTAEELSLLTPKSKP